MAEITIRNNGWNIRKFWNRILRISKSEINEVSLGIFSWAFLEPEEGVFDLEWLKNGRPPV